MSKDVNVFIESVNDLGWSMEEEGVNEYRLSKTSPAGQDFSIVIEGEDIGELIESVHETYENFDVSEETYLWLDNTGHGTNGAPYHIEDLVDDMKACEQMILDLYNVLSA